MKRRIAAFLAVTAALTAAVNVSAANSWRESTLDNGFAVEYNPSTNEVHAKGYLSKKTDTAVASTTKFIDLEIPDEIDGTPIYGIGERGFMDYDEIKSVKLPSQVTTIGTKAFWGADSFSKLALPEQLKTIGDGAFESCDALSNVSFNARLETIGERAFKNCKNISSIKLPNTVTSIGTGAFEGCRGLTNVDLGDSLSDLGGSAFKDCTSLKEVTIPKGVTTLKSNTFDGCKNLETVVLPEGLKTIENAVFGGCDSLKKVYVPGSVKTISKTAFDGSENVIFYCKNGSYAQQYALEHKFPVVTGEEIITDETVPDHITVIVNGEIIEFKNAQPVIVDSRTLVPMRDIFEALGITVGWDPETKTVTGKKGINDISLTIGSSKIYVDGKEQIIDVPAQIIDGSTMVPLRVISNSVGCKITWDQNTKTANIIG